MQKIYIIISLLFTYYIIYLNITYLLNIKLKKRYFIIGMILFILVYFILPIFKVFFQYIIFIFLFYNAIKNFCKLFSAIILNFLSQCISETILTILFIPLNIKLNSNYILLTTIICSIFSYFIIRSKYFTRIWNYLKDELKFQSLLIIAFISFCLLYICISYKTNFYSSSILVIFILILIFLLIRQISFNYVIKKEHSQLYEYLKSYEELLSQRVIDKDIYLNNLIILNEMLSKDNMAKDYINTLLNDENSLCYENVLKEVSKIYIQSVKGLLYYKLINCIRCGISCILNVDYKINLYKTDDDLNMNITEILSIMIDMAKDECLNSIQKSLSVYIYCENKSLVFEVSNTFGKVLNLEMLKKSNQKKNKFNYFKINQINNKIKREEKLNYNNEVHDDIFIQRLIVDFNK